MNRDNTSQAIPRLIERYYEQVLELAQGNGDSRGAGTSSTNTNTNRSEKNGPLLRLRQRVLGMAVRVVRKVVDYSGLSTDNIVHGRTQQIRDNDFQNGLLNTEHPGTLEAVEEEEEGQEEGKEGKQQTVPFSNSGITTERKLFTTTWLERLKSYLYTKFFSNHDETSPLIEELLAQKNHARSYTEWKRAAEKLDEVTGKSQWKQQDETQLYDYKLVREVTDKLRTARKNGDYKLLLYHIRTNWVRNLGNMGNVNLYRHSYTGTKRLIDEYVEESKLSLDALLESGLDENYLMAIFQQTRRNIGRTALVLSGGGTFGLFHIGVLATLSELDILPRVISGSSAGAIVASILSIHHREEIPALLEHVLEKEFNIFNDDSEKSEGENLLIKIQRFLKNGTWFNNKQLKQTMLQFLGDLTFREAYNRTGKILNITVSPDTLFEQPRLLNNLTAPNVLIWSAVCASCSLPGIFPSSPLFEKNPVTGEQQLWSGSSSVKFVDGSVDNDLPISRLSEMFNIDHIIACQVNIHVFPFLKMSLSCVGGEIEDEYSARLKQNLNKLYIFMVDELIHLFEMGCELGIAKSTLTKLRSVLSQQYSGDITILPDMNMLLRINGLLANPTRKFMLREITNGARATWPKVSIIQNHCGQEFALDRAIFVLKGKILASQWTKNPIEPPDYGARLTKVTTGETVRCALERQKLQQHSLQLRKFRRTSVQAIVTGARMEHDELDDELVAERESSQHSPLLPTDEEQESPKVDDDDDDEDQDMLAHGSSVNLFQQVDYTPRDSNTFSKPSRRGKSLSISELPPSFRMVRVANKNGNGGLYRTVNHKGSTGHIIFRMGSTQREPVPPGRTYSRTPPEKSRATFDAYRPYQTGLRKRDSMHSNSVDATTKGKESPTPQCKAHIKTP